MSGKVRAQLHSWGNTLCFLSAPESNSSMSIWKTDGTSVNDLSKAFLKTLGSPCRPINVMPLQYPQGEPTELTAMGDKLYFTAGDQTHGRNSGRSMWRQGRQPSWISRPGRAPLSHIAKITVLRPSGTPSTSTRYRGTLEEQRRRSEHDPVEFCRNPQVARLDYASWRFGLLHHLRLGQRIGAVEEQPHGPTVLDGEAFLLRGKPVRRPDARGRQGFLGTVADCQRLRDLEGRCGGHKRRGCRPSCRHGP